MRRKGMSEGLRRRTALVLAAVLGIGSCMCYPQETQAAVKDEVEVRDLLDEAEFTPDETNIKVSSEDPDYPGTDALCGDGVHYWKHGGDFGGGVYKDVYEPSSLFWAVDLGAEKTIESAYIVLANEAKHLNLTLDKVNAKNLSNKFEIVYTSDDRIWDQLPEASNEVCEYSWEENGWNLAGGTETEGLWSNARLNGKDWACDTKTFHHPFTARYVMVSITLLGDANLVPEHDLGLVDLQLFGYDAVKNQVELYPERADYFRGIASDVSTEFPEDEKVKSVSHITLERALEKGDGQEKPGSIVRLKKGTDYQILGNLLVFDQVYLMSLPPADNQFIVRFESGEESLFTVAVSSKSGTTSVINAVPGISPFTVLGEGLGTDEPVEGATKRIRAALPAAESHMINLFDEELGRFVMSIQAHDNDCSIGCYAHKANYNKDTGELVDGDNSRQRIEIRPSTDSGMELVAVDGDVTKYQWKWRLADDYPVSGSFNHIFQLKAVNGQRNKTLPGFTDPVQEHGKAIFSFTAVTKGLQFRSEDKVVVDQNGKEVSIPMNEVRGRWIDVSLEMLHADDGWVKVMITDSQTGEVLMDYAGNHDTWRRPYQNGVGELDYPACFDQYNRPKWGIYRNGKRDVANGLKASHIEFCDLVLTKNGENEEYFTGIEVKEPNRLNYVVGEELDLTGMVVTATSNNAQSRVLAEGEYEVDGFDSQEPGDKTVSVTVETAMGDRVYRLVKRFTVHVTEDTFHVEKIRVANLPDKTEYYIGEELDTEGLVVKAVMKASSSNASYEETIEDYDLSYSFDKAGKSPVTVTYEEDFKAIFNVTVKEGQAVDKSELKAAVEECGRITNDNYTMASWNRFLKALENAREVLEDENATEKQVEKALKDLYRAVDSLKEKTWSDDDDSDDDSYDMGREAAGSIPTESGDWSRDARGWRFKDSKGEDIIDRWGYLDWNGTGGWYFFDKDGYMITGWMEWQGKRYFLHNLSDNTMGHMYTGWHEIDGKWYYFNPSQGADQGAMARDTVTPDGYRVDAEGAWVK